MTIPLFLKRDILGLGLGLWSVNYDWDYVQVRVEQFEEDFIFLTNIMIAIIFQKLNYRPVFVGYKAKSQNYLVSTLIVSDKKVFLLVLSRSSQVSFLSSFLSSVLQKKITNFAHIYKDTRYNIGGYYYLSKLIISIYNNDIQKCHMYR